MFHISRRDAVSLIFLLTLSGGFAGSPAPGQTPTPADGSKEPIIVLPDNPTPDTGIGGSIQAPTGAPTPMASTAGGAATRYVIFVIRQQDWNDGNPSIPTSRPTGVLGKFTETWNYDGSASNRHNYHFNVTGNQEGTTFYVVVQTTATGATPTYTKMPVMIRRAN